MKTTEFLAAQLRRLGLEPAGEGGSYFQSVPFVSRRADIRLSVNDIPVVLDRDYRVLLVDAIYPAISDAQAIFGGHVAEPASWITAEQARGRFVILAQPDGSRGASTDVAHDPRFRDAVAVGYANFGQAFRLMARLYPSVDPERLYYKDPAYPPPQPRPVTFMLTDELAGRIMGSALGELKAGALGQRVSGHVRVEDIPVKARNVVAILRGDDPRLSHEYVAVSAHLDHLRPLPVPQHHDSARVFNARRRRLTLELGRTPRPQELARLTVDADSLRRNGSIRMDSIRNGADDNASGTIAVLEIAKSLSNASSRPRRSVVFIWHVAEETGLEGSRFFTDHPTVPLDSITALFNLDMIGRGGPGEVIGGGADYLQLIGAGRISTDLAGWINAVNARRERPFRFDLSFDRDGHPEQMYCRSDHFSYARRGIPVAFFTTGLHGDYHQVTDEVQYVDHVKLKHVAELVRDVVVEVANRDGRPGIDGPRPEAECRQ